MGKILLRLVDPVVAPVRTPPRSDRDLLIAAVNSWVIAGGFSNSPRSGTRPKSDFPDWENRKRPEDDSVERSGGALDRGSQADRVL